MLEPFLTTFAVLFRIVSNPFGNVFQKQLTTRNNHPLLINFLTYLLLSVFCFLVASNVNWAGLKVQFWIYSVLGGIAGALGNGFLVRALQKGDLSILGPVNSYKSVVGVVMAIFLLGEIPNFTGFIGIVLIIYGSYFVLDTTEERFSWALLRREEIQYRISALILTAIEAVFIKKIILNSSVMVAFVSWCWFGAAFAFLLLFINRINLRREISKVDWPCIHKYIFLVLCVGTMQLSTNYTFDHMPVGYALSLFQLSTIVSVLLGRRFFQEKDIRKKLIGTAIMVTGSIMIILFKDL
jgi:drug/metabolite transporter (DMT)-like permease